VKPQVQATFAISKPASTATNNMSETAMPEKNTSPVTRRREVS
jgi:hypothetical protein